MQFLTAISEGSSFDPAKVEKLKIAIGKERQEVSDNVEQRAFYEQVWGLITLCGLDKKNGKKEPGAGAGRIPALRWVIDRLSYKSRSISEHKDSIQVGIEQTLFWSLGLMAMRIFGNHYAALAAATWSLFILAHFVRTKNMPQAPPLNKLLTVTLINLIAFAAPYACDIPKPLFWIGMTAGFTISTYIHYKLEKSPRIVSARHSSGYTGRTAAHTASSRIERVDPATSVPSTIASTIVPIRQPEVDSVLKELASRLKPSDRFPRDIKDSEATALSIIGSLCSLMLQKKVVLVFDAGMGGVEGRKALAVIEVIRQLKRDAGSNYAKLLKNVEVITVQPHRFGEKIAPYKAQGAEIFIFAREGERALVKAITGDAVNMHAAFVSENELAPDAYYPIFEIVAATLAQYVYSIPLDDIKKALKAVNVDLTADASDGALVFRLLPPTEHYNTGELMMKYARLKEFLIKA
jgi:hypothetical protein